MPKANTAVAKYDMKTLVVPPTVELLDDNAQWTNRFDFVSKSGNVYRVAQNKSGRWWACDCPSWKFKKNGVRHCKHLRDFGLPPDYEAFEVGEIRLALPGEAAPEIGAKPQPKSAIKAKPVKAKKAPKPVAAANQPAAALPSAPEALPGCKPKSVQMKGDEIVVTFDAKDSAAVFALLAKLSEGEG